MFPFKAPATVLRRDPFRRHKNVGVSSIESSVADTAVNVFPLKAQKPI